MLNFFISKSILILGFLSILGCETTSSVEKIEYSSEEVLYKLGDKKPINSKIDEEKWILIASSENPSVDSIYANIAVGENESAIKLARTYLSEAPNNLDAFEALSRALVASKKSELAAYYARYVLEKDSSRSGMNNVLGLAKALNAKTITDYNKAKELLKKAYLGKRRSLAAGLNLAYLELETGAIEKSRNLFKTISKSCNECPPSLIGLGITERRLGNLSASISALEDAISNSDSSYVAQYHLALSHRADNKLSKARDIVNDLIDEAPSSENLLISKAESLHQQLRIEMEDNE